MQTKGKRQLLDAGNKLASWQVSAFGGRRCAFPPYVLSEDGPPKLEPVPPA